MRPRIRVALGLAGIMAMVGMLWASVAPVRACSCALPLDDATAREVLASSDLVVAGSVAETARDRVELSVERVYAGDAVESVTVAQPEGFSGEYGNPGNLFGGEIGADCSYAITGGRGERYLLVLRESAGGGSYKAQGCTSMALRLTQTDDYFAKSFQAIERAAGPAAFPQAPEEESGGGGRSWLPVAGAIGGGVVLGLVGVGAFLWRAGRREVGNE
jgi:hypothetical protein